VAGGAAETVSGGDARAVAGGAAETVAGGDARAVAGGAAETVAGGDARTAPGGAADTVPGGDADSASGDGADASPGGRATLPRRSRLSWPRFVRGNPRRAAGVAVIAVLLLTGGGLGLAAQQLKDPAASGNHALTDTDATSQVTGDVSDALSRVFAYTPDDTQSTAQAARDLLEGAAAQQYQKLFAQIRQQVAAQQLTLSTRVVRAGVVSLTGDRARLLVFLDQTAQRAGATATSAAAQLSVTAHLVGGHWRITDLKAR
jgi:Mce-associated membrane protein